MTSWLQIRLQSARLASMVFFVIFACCACQSAPSPSPLPSATDIPPTTTPSQTPLPATATKAPTSTQRPTATATPSPEPSAPPEEAGLSLGGPWLVLSDTTINGLGYQESGVVLVNQDGSVSAEILNAPYCGGEHNPLIEHPANRVVKLGWPTFLVNPQLKKACMICGLGHDCTTYTGEGQNLLADVSQEADGGVWELRVHKLPEGTLLASFPLMQCSVPSNLCDANTFAGNNFAGIGPTWDPAGQNLAYPVIINGGTALHVFDSKTGTAREIARLEGAITYIWWSPDGANLVFGVEDLADPYRLSINTVTLTGGSLRMLYTPEKAYPHEIITWVDDHRFLDCEGSIRDVVMEGAYNLRLVDIRSGQVTMLLNDGFIDLALDRKSETVVVVNAVYTSIENQGLYLISLADPKPLFMGPPMSYQVDWDANRGLYLTGTLCPDDAELLLAFDPQGKITCLPPEPENTPPPDIPAKSPDGQWSVALDDGLWIEGPGQARVKVLDETPVNIIWRLDSSGLFAVMRQGLEYISLPDQTVTHIALAGQPFPPYGSEIAYEWIGGEEKDR